MRTVLSEKTITRLVRGLYAVCALLVLSGVAYQLVGPGFEKAHYSFETWPGFYGAFGFVAFVFIVYCGRLLRRLVQRDEEYYAHDEPERSK